jgi:hypothetical protein
METKTWWFRWIANHARHIFWGVWGAGAGAFGAVLFRAVDVGGDALRVYMGVLTVMMGGALGIVTSRTMDHYSDRRKVRRKIFTALSRLQEVQGECLKLERHINRVTDNGKKPIDQINVGLGQNDATLLVIGMSRIKRAAEKGTPDFDEIVESVDEAELASRVAVQLDYLADYFRLGDFDSQPVSTAIDIVARHLKADVLREPMEIFQAAIAHYRTRLGDQ